MQLGSHNFDAYARNLRRIMWAEFIDVQIRARRDRHFRASLVDNPYTVGPTDLGAQFEYHRHRKGDGGNGG